MVHYLVQFLLIAYYDIDKYKRYILVMQDCHAVNKVVLAFLQVMV